MEQKTNNKKSAGAFTWHQVSAEEKKQIRKKAESILGNFSKNLSKLEKSKEFREPLIERDNSERKERDLSSKTKTCSIKREKFFDNAPISDKKKGKIIAEIGHWVN
ncbi:MAG: hypothetical protein ACOCUU_01890 [Nanoarchaeota archaeon]